MTPGLEATGKGLARVSVCPRLDGLKATASSRLSADAREQAACRRLYVCARGDAVNVLGNVAWQSVGQCMRSHTLGTLEILCSLVLTLRCSPDACLLGMALRTERLEHVVDSETRFGKGHHVIEFISALIEAAIVWREAVQVAIAVWIGAFESVATGDEHALVGGYGGTVGARVLFE